MQAVPEPEVSGRLNCWWNCCNLGCLGGYNLRVGVLEESSHYPFSFVLLGEKKKKKVPLLWGDKLVSLCPGAYMWHSFTFRQSSMLLKLLLLPVNAERLNLSSLHVLYNF